MSIDLPSLSVLILTYNEEKHIARCIESVLPISKKIFIIDSYSTDKTVKIAESLGAKCYQHKWENNHALQFNWGLETLPIDTDWVMRLDADEYILPNLALEVKEKLSFLDEGITGININRRVIFMDRWIKRGGYYPVTLLRIWRNGLGYLEQRWMDEHVKLKEGKIVSFKNDFVDHNLNSLSWWIIKHNNYASREAIDYLIYKCKFEINENISSGIMEEQGKRKRWFKEKVYFKIPLFLRPFLYFFFRYFLKFGIFDGKQGLIWHFLQGFWYRFLVDAKIFEIYKQCGKDREKIKGYLSREYGLTLDTIKK